MMQASSTAAIALEKMFPHFYLNPVRTYSSLGRKAKYVEARTLLETGMSNHLLSLLLFLSDKVTL